MVIGSRKTAHQAGLKHYYTGKPCLRGHVAVRLVSSKGCIGCTKLKRATHPELLMLSAAKQRAARVGVPFDITARDILDVWPSDGRCPILLVPMVTGVGTGNTLATSPTLDRADPALGYVRGNIAVISNKANLMKSDGIEPAVFRRIADYMENQKRIHFVVTNTELTERYPSAMAWIKG